MSYIRYVELTRELWKDPKIVVASNMDMLHSLIIYLSNNVSFINKYYGVNDFVEFIRVIVIKSRFLTLSNIFEVLAYNGDEYTRGELYAYIGICKEYKSVIINRIRKIIRFDKEILYQIIELKNSTRRMLCKPVIRAAALNGCYVLSRILCARSDNDVAVIINECLTRSLYIDMVHGINSTAEIYDLMHRSQSWRAALIMKRIMRYCKHAQTKTEYKLIKKYIGSTAIDDERSIISVIRLRMWYSFLRTLAKHYPMGFVQYLFTRHNTNDNINFQDTINILVNAQYQKYAFHPNVIPDARYCYNHDVTILTGHNTDKLFRELTDREMITKYLKMLQHSRMDI